MTLGKFLSCITIFAGLGLSGMAAFAQQRAVNKVAAQTGVHDYIACLFDQKDLTSLRKREPATELDKAAATTAAATLSVTIDELVRDKTLDESRAAELKSKLTPPSIVGLNGQQLLNKVQTTVKGTLGINTQAKVNADTAAAAAALMENTSQSLTATAQRINAGVFQTPDDVACSMSALTYRETSDVFGRRVAQEYVAFQIVVRNLNADTEFLLHDVQLAVDTDPCGSFERFDGGRDRLLVRAVALRNQSTDPRNRVVRILEGVGSIAGAAITLGTSEFAAGVGVFSAVVPAGKNVFPDYTVDQLNRLSDLAFTSSGQTRTVVGKNGVAMFMTFIPTKPLEQSWWIDQATQVPKTTGGSSCNTLPAQRVKETAYKKWSSNALLEFRRHTFVVVAGVHIVSADDLIPELKSLSCPMIDGVLDLGQAKTRKEAPSTLECTVTGSNLGKIGKVTLQNGLESADTATAMATLVPTPGDPTTGKLTFKGDELRALTGVIYNVMWVDASTVPQSTGKTIKLKPFPVVTEVSPSSLALSAHKTGALKLSGLNLKLIDGVQLTADPASVEGKVSVMLKPDANTATDTTLSVPYEASDLSGLTAGNYRVSVTSGGKPVEAATDKAITLIK